MGIVALYVQVRAWLMRRKIGPADIVLIGGSSVEYWKSSEDDLQPLISRNFGIGGSTAAQWVRLARELVLPFMPKAVFIFAGSNDLHLEKVSPDVAFESLKRLFSTLTESLPDAKLYYAGVYLTNRFREHWEADREYNQLAREYAQNCDALEYIDVPAALTGENGESLESIFRKDGEHLNERGYELWRKAVMPSVR